LRSFLTPAGSSGHQLGHWLTIESFGFAIVGLSAAAAIWRDIEATPESIAFDGVKLLKKSIE